MVGQLFLQAFEVFVIGLLRHEAHAVRADVAALPVLRNADIRVAFRVVDRVGAVVFKGLRPAEGRARLLQAAVEQRGAVGGPGEIGFARRERLFLAVEILLIFGAGHELHVVDADEAGLPALQDANPQLAFAVVQRGLAVEFDGRGAGELADDVAAVVVQRRAVADAGEVRLVLRHLLALAFEILLIFGAGHEVHVVQRADVADTAFVAHRNPQIAAFVDLRIAVVFEHGVRVERDGGLPVGTGINRPAFAQADEVRLVRGHLLLRRKRRLRDALLPGVVVALGHERDFIHGDIAGLIAQLHAHPRPSVRADDGIAAVVLNYVFVGHLHGLRAAGSGVQIAAAEQVAVVRLAVGGHRRRKRRADDFHAAANAGVSAADKVGVVIIRALRGRKHKRRAVNIGQRVRVDERERSLFALSDAAQIDPLAVVNRVEEVYFPTAAVVDFNAQLARVRAAALRKLQRNAGLRRVRVGPGKIDALRQFKRLGVRLPSRVHLHGRRVDHGKRCEGHRQQNGKQDAENPSRHIQSLLTPITTKLRLHCNIT